MINHPAGKPRRIFSLERLRQAHLSEMSNWLGEEGGGGIIPDEQSLLNSMYTGFRRQYRPLWDSGEMDSHVMTVNRVPVFCVSLLRMRQPAGITSSRNEAHLYLLCRPQVRISDRLLLMAWQAATVNAFLRLQLSGVQTAINAANTEENEALLMLGYRLIESISEGRGKMNVYTCERLEMRMVM